MTAFGASCREVSRGNANTGLGMNAGKNLKSGSLNVTLGFGAGGNLDADLSENGKVQTEPALAGTYSQTGTTITVTAPASGVVAGNKVGIRFPSGDLSATGDMHTMNVASNDHATTFTLTMPTRKTL